MVRDRKLISEIYGLFLFFNHLLQMTVKLANEVQPNFFFNIKLRSQALI